MPKTDAKIESIRSRLLDGMRAYMAEGDVSYDESDVRERDQHPPVGRGVASTTLAAASHSAAAL